MKTVFLPVGCECERSGRKYIWGQDFGYTVNGVSIKRYANESIGWEISKKMNVGIELGLFDKVEIQADYYTERRSNHIDEQGGYSCNDGAATNSAGKYREG